MTAIPVLVQLNSLILGGSELNAVDLAATTKALGFDSLLVGPRDTLPIGGPSLLDVARDRGVAVLPIERRRTTLAAARQLSQVAGWHGARLVHTYGAWTIRPAFWGPCLAARRPLVMTVYEMQVQDKVPRGPSLVIGTKYLEEEQAFRRGPVHLVSPPVDLSTDDPGVVDSSGFLAEHGLNPEHRRMVIVSRLDHAASRPVKSVGIETAIHCVDALGDAEVDLVVVGSGPDEERLREIGRGVNDRIGREGVVFTGAMSDPRPAYRCADIVIGMGGSAARGLAFGKPLVVAGEFGWFGTFAPDTASDMFRNSFWSEARPPDPVRMLVDQVRPLLADDARRESLGRFGREFAVANFGLDVMAEKLAGVYEAALSSYRLRDWTYDLALEVGHA